MRSFSACPLASSTKFLADREGAVGERHIGDAVALDLFQLRVEVLQHVGDVGRGCDRHHGRGLGDPVGGCEDRGAAERVADKQRGCREPRAQVIRGAHEILDVEENVVFSNSPCDDPSPVKSKRRTAMPREASFAAMCRAAMTSFEHVKQCANNA